MTGGQSSPATLVATFEQPATPLFTEQTTLIAPVPHRRSFWYPLCFAEDIAEKPLRRRLLGHDLVVWAAEPISGAGLDLDGGTVTVAHDRCPHRDAALSAGWVSDGCIVCPYHGWEYGTDGVAVHIPQLTGASPIPPRARLATYAAEIRHGLVWTTLNAPAQPIQRSGKTSRVTTSLTTSTETGT